MSERAERPGRLERVVEDFTALYQIAEDLSRSEPEDAYYRRQIVAGLTDAEIATGIRASSREPWWHQARVAAWRRHEEDAGVRPWERTATDTPPQRPTGIRWREIVLAHRRTGQARPKQLEVAMQMDFNNEQPLRARLRGLGISNWRDVHALIATEPE